MTNHLCIFIENTPHNVTQALYGSKCNLYIRFINMRFVLYITVLLACAAGQQFSEHHSRKEYGQLLTKENKTLYVNCYSDLNSLIYNVVSHTDLPRMELHVTCNTKTDNIFRIVGDLPNSSFHCLENVTTVVSWLGEFSKNAKSLDLSNNCIKTLNTISELPELRILNCRHNSIESIEEGAFEHLKYLEILDLSNNSLTGDRLSREVFKKQCLPSKFSSDKAGLLKMNGSYELCASLPIKVLILGHNNIRFLHSNTFQYLHNLRELHLNHNPLSIVDANTISAIKSITTLKVLHLSHLHIRVLPYNLLDGLKIKALYLNSNNLTEVPEELSFLGKSLLYLNINDNPITTLNYDSFMGLNNLNEIEAAGLSQLTSVNEGTFSHIHTLETVILSYNPQLSYIDPFAFRWSSKSPSSLRLVYLHRNNLKHISENLLPWNQLEVLQLSGNPWVCDCKLRWYLDLTEKRNLDALKKSGLRCATSTWPNITETDVYNRPIRKFDCANNPESYLKYKTNSVGEYVVIIMFLAAVVSVLSAVLVRCAYQTSRRDDAANNLYTLSGSLKNDIMYTKIHNKSTYNV